MCLLIFRYICWLNKHGINYTLSKKIAYNNVQVCNNDYIILQGKLLCWKYVNFRKNWTASHQYEAQIDQSSSLKVHVSEHCKETWNFLKQTDGIRYCKHIIFSMYDIWWKWFFSDLVWIWISIFLKVPILLHKLYAYQCTWLSESHIPPKMLNRINNQILYVYSHTYII